MFVGMIGLQLRQFSIFLQLILTPPESSTRLCENVQLGNRCRHTEFEWIKKVSTLRSGMVICLAHCQILIPVMMIAELLL